MFPIYQEEHVRANVAMQHREAIQAELLNRARAGKPGPIVALAIRIRTSIGSRIHALNKRNLQPIASATPPATSETGAEPAPAHST